MASDLSKFADHALVLTRQANGLLTGLYDLKQVLQLEQNNATDILWRGGSLNVTFQYKEHILKVEPPTRPGRDRLSLFIDPTINSIQKQVVKKFPDVKDIGKVSTVCPLLCMPHGQAGALHISLARVWPLSTTPTRCRSCSHSTICCSLRPT
jgi:hypothetical protein